MSIKLIELLQNHVTEQKSLSDLIEQVEIKLVMSSELSRGYASEIDKAIIARAIIFLNGEEIGALEDSLMA